jgi:uncharacterized protein (TIGR03000 family)
MRRQPERQIFGRLLAVTVVVLYSPGKVSAEPPWYTGHVHIGEENEYTRSIPGSFNKYFPPDYGPYPASSYNWPSARQALDEYGWFGRRYHKGGNGFGRSYDDLSATAKHSTYEQVKAPEMSAPALIRVEVPDSARIWFDDQPTSQTGPSRLFITSPLKSGGDYVYRVRARWKSGDKEVDRTLTVQLKGGENKAISFVEKP